MNYVGRNHIRDKAKDWCVHHERGTTLEIRTQFREANFDRARRLFSWRKEARRVRSRDYNTSFDASVRKFCLGSVNCLPLPYWSIDGRRAYLMPRDERQQGGRDRGTQTLCICRWSWSKSLAPSGVYLGAYMHISDAPGGSKSDASNNQSLYLARHPDCWWWSQRTVRYAHPKEIGKITFPRCRHICVYKRPLPFKTTCV